MRRFLTPALLTAALCLSPATGASVIHRVPYRLSETQHLLVRARLNGKGPFNFIIDTGAPALFVSPETAKRAGLTAGKGGWAPVDRLEIEGRVMLDGVEARVEEPPQLTGMNAMGLAGTRLDGILGYTILSRFRMEIDLSQPWMSWTPVPYQPKPLLGLDELAGGKPVAPPPNAGALQMVARLAAMLFPRAVEDTTVYRGFLGFEVDESAGGLKVKSVLAGGPAAVGGLRPGDRLVRVGGGAGGPTPIKTSVELYRLAAGLEAAQEMILEIERDRQPARITVRAAKGAF